MRWLRLREEGGEGFWSAQDSPAGEYERPCVGEMELCDKPWIVERELVNIYT